MKRLQRFLHNNLIALLALFIALGGSAYAVGKSSVGTPQLKNGAVSRAKLKNNAVNEKKLAGSVRAKLMQAGQAGPEGPVGPVGPKGATGVENLTPSTATGFAEGNGSNQYVTALCNPGDVATGILPPIDPNVQAATLDVAIQGNQNGYKAITTAPSGNVFLKINCISTD